MNEVNNLENSENVILVEPPMNAYEVAQDIHTVLVVLSIFVMGFCMFRFLKSCFRK